MRRNVWLASAAAAVLIALVAVVGLRGTAPEQPARQVSATAPPPAAAKSPAAVAVKPAAPKPLPAPSFDVVTVDKHGQAVIAGRAAPGDKVQVLDAGKPIGEATADRRGEWVLVPQKPMAVGSRELSLEATGPKGGPSRRSKSVVALSIGPAGGKAASTLAVLLPGEPGRPARVLQRPQAPLPGHPLSLDTAALGAKDRLQLSGEAHPGARLELYAGDRSLGAATADADGRWSFTAPQRYAGGRAELRVEELAPDGKIARRVAQLFEPPSGAPTTAAEAKPGHVYVVERGNSLWLIARDAYGEGMRYTTIYAANRSRIRDPNLIYPGQHFRLPRP